MSSKNKNIIILLIIITISIVGYFAISFYQKKDMVIDGTSKNMTLSGTYTCLPHLDISGPQTKECAFGIKTDDGVYYAVNFGASAGVIEQFQGNKHIKAEGFVVIKEALSPDEWAKYNMKGMFTITKMLESASVQGNL